MALCRVFTELGGNVRVIHANERLRQPGESDAAFIARIGADTVARDSSLAGLPFVDVDRADILVLDRSQRHKWRVTGNKVRVDPAIPDRPHPRQARLDAINAATTIDELKAELVKFIKGE